MIIKQRQARVFYAQTTLNSTFSCSLVHANHKIMRGLKYEKNNRKTRSMHGLRTMRSLLHHTAFKIKRHNQSLQQRTPQTHKQNQTRSKQTRLLRHPMPPLRRRTLRNRLPIRRHAQKTKKQAKSPTTKKNAWAAGPASWFVHTAPLIWIKKAKLSPNVTSAKAIAEPACVANCPNQALVFKEVKP